MAKRKPVKRRPKTVARRKRAAVKRSTSRARVGKRGTPRKATPPEVRQGLITHTELASADPSATRAWCEDVLGWVFGSPVPTPAGPYHMWRFGNGTGGGIRANNHPEVPGSIPYCQVADIQATYSKALAAGAIEMLRPEQLPGGMGWVAIVAVPGGVAIGFWAAK